ncbi:hypothetical protein EGR_06380 [Echinococcus granulosus]|uniref:Uncharacterized protein n=1 Tax=Echinococcus granulosus TaxID=6210 RepID=W6UYQ2_ECHGR|nr:hypothetical protein EGR_06380 [Echinococcus granulosus]EUB58709.1 hypothetical protein EGR_06380 [Echinococcus granulosus]
METVGSIHEIILTTLGLEIKMWKTYKRRRIVQHVRNFVQNEKKKLMFTCEGQIDQRSVQFTTSWFSLKDISQLNLDRVGERKVGADVYFGPSLPSKTSNINKALYIQPFLYKKPNDKS